MGIVNVTEDSFSDGGLYLNSENAITHSLKLASDGADIIDIGPASSHPDAKAVSAQEEIERISPVIRALEEKGITISVDSFLPDTHRFCARRGVDYINDILGFPDRDVYAEIADSPCKLIVMHSIQQRGKAVRTKTDPNETIDRISVFFETRVRELNSAGIEKDRLVLDPGMGFFLGSNPEPSLMVLQNIETLKNRFELPILVSVSRKSFLGELTGKSTDQRASATLAAELFAANQHVNYIRTHDVASLSDALKVMSALNR